ESGREKLHIRGFEAEFHGLVEFERPVTREYGCHRCAFTQVEADYCFSAHAFDNTDTTVECAARLMASFRKNRLRSQAHDRLACAFHAALGNGNTAELRRGDHRLVALERFNRYRQEVHLKIGRASCRESVEVSEDELGASTRK